MSKFTVTVAGGLAIWLGAASSPGHAAGNPFAAQYVKALRESGVQADAAGLKAFLKTYHPGTDQEQRYRNLVTQLGADDYFEREEAMRQLLLAPAPIAGALAAAADGPDAEVRWRARLILEETSQSRNDLLYAAFVVINDQRIAGLAGDLLGTLPLCRSEHVRTALARALEATATPDDAELFREALKSSSPEARVVAAKALSTCVGEAAAPDLLALFEDSDDEVRLEAAELMVAKRPERALPLLARLLSSSSLKVRNRSIQLLRSTTRLDLPFSGYRPEEERALEAAAWQDAVDAFVKEKKSVGTIPDHSVDVERRFVLNAYQQDLLIGWTPLGGFEYSKGMAGAIDCCPSRAGHCWYAFHRDEHVAEIDDHGVTVRKFPTAGMQPIVAEELPNGNLAVGGFEGTLAEYAPDGRMIRQKMFEGRVRDLVVLRDGELAMLLVKSLETRQGSVIRLSADWGEQWRSTLFEGMPIALCPLANDHLLMVNYDEGVAFDLDPNGHFVELESRFEHPRQVAQLPDVTGTLVVVDDDGVHLAAHDGAKLTTLREFPRPKS